MGFSDLKRMIRDRSRRLQESGLNSVEYQEMEEARTLLKQLRTNHNIAYRQRKEEWFAENPAQQYFSPTLEEAIRDTRLEEWTWYFIERIFSRTPEQRYQDERNPSYGWNHLSNVHGIEEACREGCRFWSEYGRIEDLEILEDYKEFDRYAEVRKVWMDDEEEEEVRS